MHQRPWSPARDRTITVVKQLGRRRWKKTSGYHRQSRVENTFFRDKCIISAMAFAPRVQLDRGVRSSSAVRSSIG